MLARPSFALSLASELAGRAHHLQEGAWASTDATKVSERAAERSMLSRAKRVYSKRREGTEGRKERSEANHLGEVV